MKGILIRGVEQSSPVFIRNLIQRQDALQQKIQCPFVSRLFSDEDASFYGG